MGLVEGRGYSFGKGGRYQGQQRGWLGGGLGRARELDISAPTPFWPSSAISELMKDSSDERCCVLSIRSSLSRWSSYTRTGGFPKASPMWSQSRQVTEDWTICSKVGRRVPVLVTEVKPRTPPRGQRGRCRSLIYAHCRRLAHSVRTSVTVFSASTAALSIIQKPDRKLATSVNRMVAV